MGSCNEGLGWWSGMIMAMYTCFILVLVARLHTTYLVSLPSHMTGTSKVLVAISGASRDSEERTLFLENDSFGVSREKCSVVTLQLK